jgi:hydrogenase maturation factor
MMCVPEVQLGEYVIVHAGIAISKIDAEAAEIMLATISDIDFDEWQRAESL